MTNLSNISTDSGHKYRILLVVRWPVGGIRTFIRYVFSHFDPDAFHFTILGPDLPEMDFMLEDLRAFDVEMIKVGERPSAFEFFKAVASLVARKRFNLVHSQGFTSGICVAVPAFLAGCPHMLTSHDVLNKKQFQGIKGRLKKMGMGTVFSMVQVIHSVSHDAQQNLLEYFPFLDKKLGKCVVIPNGIEVGRFDHVEPRGLRSELDLGADTFLIGFLGRFMAQKGFCYLVDAIESLSRNENLPRKLLVVTFGEDGFIREEKAKIAERGLERYFRFLPFTPNVAGVIKALDVVVMPSLWEACPLLPMEVFVCGTPLIATDCIGLREVIAGSPARVVPPRDSGSLAKALVLEMSDSSSFTRASGFVEQARMRFDVKRQAIDIYNKYLVLLNGNHK